MVFWQLFETGWNVNFSENRFFTFLNFTLFEYKGKFFQKSNSLLWIDYLQNGCKWTFSVKMIEKRHHSVIDWRHKKRFHEIFFPERLQIRRGSISRKKLLRKRSMLIRANAISRISQATQFYESFVDSI